MHVLKNTENCVNVKVITLVFLCANQFSCSKQNLDKKQLKTFKTPEKKYTNMSKTTTSEKIITEDDSIKVPFFAKLMTSSDYTNLSQIRSDFNKEYHWNKRNIRLQRSTMKRERNEINTFALNNSHLSRTQMINPPISQCYLCKTSSISSINSLNLTQKYKGMKYMHYIMIRDITKSCNVICNWLFGILFIYNYTFRFEQIERIILF